MKFKSVLNYDFRHSIINQLWKLFSGPLLLVLVPLYLSTEVQGYWYTFISMAALAVFADMGFSAVLLLFSSHEFANLEFDENKILAGERYNLIRLATLLQFAMKWSAVMALLVFPLVLMVGYIIFEGKVSSVEWKFAWLVYGVASIFVFLNSMLLSFIEGCDSVGDVQKVRFHVSVIAFVVTVILLIGGAGLYALSVSLFVSAFSGFIVIAWRYRNMLVQLYKLAKVNTHSWWSEVSPLVWRFALSWISGYFIFSIFTPITFHYFGVVEAGQVGLSMAICMAIFGIANVWVTMVTPKLNMYVARHNYDALNRTFKFSVCMASLTYLVGCAGFYFVVILVDDYIPIKLRLLPLKMFSMIALALFAQIFINGMAVYMRAHKVEPLVLASILNGLYVAVTTLVVALYFPFEYLFFGFLSAYMLIIPWVYVIFKKYSRKTS